jgi:hypothetical protein
MPFRDRGPTGRGTRRRREGQCWTRLRSPWLAARRDVHAEDNVDVAHQAIAVDLLAPIVVPAVAPGTSHGARLDYLLVSHSGAASDSVLVRDVPQSAVRNYLVDVSNERGGNF